MQKKEPSSVRLWSAIEVAFIVCTFKVGTVRIKPVDAKAASPTGPRRESACMSMRAIGSACSFDQFDMYSSYFERTNDRFTSRASPTSRVALSLVRFCLPLTPAGR
jgi:hypothetical protein